MDGACNTRVIEDEHTKLFRSPEGNGTLKCKPDYDI
jgi:hypothetical protein